jgi:hypothetical protein
LGLLRKDCLGSHQCNWLVVAYDRFILASDLCRNHWWLATSVGENGAVCAVQRMGRVSNGEN